MQLIDWIVLWTYFLMLIVIGFIAYKRVKNSADFFTAGGKLPWWLSGISHHVSGYSGAVFVAYAGIAYTHGFTIYIWWACGVATATFFSALFIAPRWARLRIKTGIQSPTEYLDVRYNIKTQQIIARSGAIIKIFDIGGKLAAIAILLNIFTGYPLIVGILLAGTVALVYTVVGRLCRCVERFRSISGAISGWDNDVCNDYFMVCHIDWHYCNSNDIRSLTNV